MPLLFAALPAALRRFSLCGAVSRKEKRPSWISNLSHDFLVALFGFVSIIFCNTLGYVGDCHQSCTIKVAGIGQKRSPCMKGLTADNCTFFFNPCILCGFGRVHCIFHGVGCPILIQNCALRYSVFHQTVQHFRIVGIVALTGHRSKIRCAFHSPQQFRNDASAQSAPTIIPGHLNPF